MLVEIAIGDAYGAGFEFAPDQFVAENNNLSRYFPHPKDGHSLPVGSYTDDTQMSIALTELILAGGPYTNASVADAFVNTFKRDPRQGYAERFFTLLKSCDSGKDLLDNIMPSSTRNGAMMRSVPLGIISDAGAVLRIAALQAAVTHDTFEGKLSSQVIALMSHALIRGAPIRDLPRIVRNDLEYELVAWPDGVRVACDADQTVRAVWSALSATKTMSEALTKAVSFGGDTDSVAAVTLGLASVGDTHAHDLPAHLYRDLDNGWAHKNNYGLCYLRNLDKDIASSLVPW